MSYAALWWTSGYEQARIIPDFTAAVVGTPVHGGIGNPYYYNTITGIKNISVAGGDRVNVAITGSDDVRAHGTKAEGYFSFYTPGYSRPYGGFASVRACRKESPYQDIRGNEKLTFPFEAPGNPTIIYIRSVINPYDIPAGSGPPGDPLYVANRRMYVWQPHAWWGSRGTDVMTSMLLFSGVPHSAFEKEHWSNAHTQQLQHGAGGAVGTIRQFYKRAPGESVGQALMKMARHTWDLFSVQMNGKLSLISRLYPEGGGTSIAGLTLKDGVVSVSCETTDKHLVNIVYASYGRWYIDSRMRTPGTSNGEFHANIKTVEVPTGYRDSDGMPWQEIENAASIANYGKRTLTSMKVTFVQAGFEEQRAGFHLPLLSSANTDGTWAADDAEQSVIHFFRRLDIDAKPRREIRIVQDMRGVDYDCGWKVANVAVMNDGQTIPDMRCIRKAIDFRDMSVTSTLLEEPAV